MKMRYHKELTVDKWQRLTLAERLANVGSEVIRTLNWKEKNKQQCQLAFERSLELFDLTKVVETSWCRRREIARLKEAWVDFVVGQNRYKTSPMEWMNEFMRYTFLARNPSASSGK